MGIFDWFFGLKNKKRSDNYYTNGQIKKEEKEITRSSKTHTYMVTEYYENGDIKSHRIYNNGRCTIGYLDPSGKTNEVVESEKTELDERTKKILTALEATHKKQKDKTLDDKIKDGSILWEMELGRMGRKKSKKEDKVEEKNKDIDQNKKQEKNDQCICIKSRNNLKKVNLQIYHSFKENFMSEVVVDISKRKEVVFTSNSHDECNDWINQDLVFKGNKKLNGKHKYIFETGFEYYEGEWKDGRKNGYGVWKDTEYGDIHEGQWKDGKQNGIGTYKDSNGKIITGDWKDGKIEIEDITYSEENGKVLIEGGEILINKKK
jgi:hypothetical protein